MLQIQTLSMARMRKDQLKRRFFWQKSAKHLSELKLTGMFLHDTGSNIHKFKDYDAFSQN